MRRVVGGLLVLVWVLCAHQRARIWHDDASLWSDALTKAGIHPRPAINFGRAMENDGNFETALRWTVAGRRRSEVQTEFSSERYRQWHSIALTNEARLRARAGDFHAAEELSLLAIHQSPGSLPPRMTYALVMFAEGRCTPPVNGTVKCPDPPMP